MKPIIGITSILEIKPKKEYSSISQNYISSVILAGGLPIIIPNGVGVEEIDTYLDTIDGLLLSGGEDIAPYLYGEGPIKEVNYLNPERDYFEIALAKKAIQREIPVLGICRGMQVINVALGGTLYQDIHKQLEDKIGHLPLEMPVNRLYHSIQIEENSILYDIFNTDDMLINSFHHQAVKTLGEGLMVNAYSKDGIIEGIELKGKKHVVGIQSHPEDLTKDYSYFVELFRYLVGQAKV